MDVTEVSRQAWNAVKLETQPEYDSLMRNYALELQQRAEGVITTGEAEEGESYNARFEQKVKELNEYNNEDLALANEGLADYDRLIAENEESVIINELAMAAEIPEDVKEELVEEVVEEVVEEKPKKKPRKVQVREPQVPRKPKIIKAAKPAAKKK